ncbi:MAG: molybdopterin-dependent oxidoreductase [Anaerolineae bacterium]
MATVNITINGQKIFAKTGQTVLEAALEAGVDIPRLCHHPAVKPYGACRVCLVEITGQRTLHPACTFPVSEGMEVFTESPKVVEARRFVLYLLFSERNHYCMYCQMSGDCELQALAYRYGLDYWKYPRPFTPLPVDASRTYFVMDHNRCILCRRCVRACGELVGNHTLGVRQRGANTMICADLNVPFGESTCLSCGTCLQVCPTGALMDRHSAYRGLEKDVERVKSVCAACSVGCGVELVARQGHLLRIEGDWDAPVNRGLLCELGRFKPLFEARRRVQVPLVRRDGALREATWDEALEAVAEGLKGGDAVALASPRATHEALGAFVRTFGGLGVRLGILTPVPEFLTKPEGSLTALDEADLYVVVGVDLGKDFQVAGFAVRRGVANRGARLVLLGGEESDLARFARYRLDASQVDQAVALAQGAENPVVVYGAGAGEALPRLRAALTGKAQFVGLVPGANARAALALGLNGARPDGAKAAFVLAADDQVDEGLLGALAGVRFLAVQASYWGPLVERAHVVLPAATWVERAGTFVNTEGRVQDLRPAVQAPAGVKTDEEILTALAGRLG